MEDFLAEAQAGAPRSDLSDRLLVSARKIARGITASVMPRRGYVKGVSERWSEAHLGKSPPKLWTGYSGFTPDSPEHGSPGVDLSPERVGPLSFERRRRVVAEHLAEHLDPLQA